MSLTLALGLPPRSQVGLGRPSWLHPDATFGINYTLNQAWQNDGLVPIVPLHTVTRAGNKYVQNANGDFQTFGPNVLGYTNLGLSVRDEETSLVQSGDSTHDVSTWATRQGATITPTGQTVAGIFESALVQDTGLIEGIAQITSSDARLAADEVGFLAFYRAGTSGRARVKFKNREQSTSSFLNGSVGSLSISSEAAGTFSNLEQISWSNGVYEVRGVVTLAQGSTNGMSLGIGPDSTTNANVEACGAMMALQAYPPEFIVGAGNTTRPRDSIQLADLSWLDVTQGSMRAITNHIPKSGPNDTRIIGGGGSNHTPLYRRNTNEAGMFGGTLMFANLGFDDYMSRVKTVSVWDAVGRSLVANDGLVSSDTNVVGDLTALWVMSNAGIAAISNGFLEEFQYIPSRLSDVDAKSWSAA